MRKLKINSGFVFFLVFTLFALTAIGVDASVNESNDSISEEISMILGDLHPLSADGLQRISIADPTIVDVVNPNSAEPMLVARKPGETLVFIWDSYGKSTILVRVAAVDLTALKRRIGNVLREAGLRSVSLEANPLENKIIVSGEIPYDQKDRFQKALTPFTNNIINFVKIEGVDDLIQIDVQIFEVNSSYSKELGVIWGDAAGKMFTVTEDSPVTRDFFKIGKFSRGDRLTATFSAMEKDGKGRFLSKPKLVVKSGEKANLVVGGEFPIKTTTFNSTGTTQENIEYKEYGIQLEIGPTVRGDKVDLYLALDITEIDSSLSDPVSGAFPLLKRNTETQLYVDSGETIIMAGLLQNRESTQTRRVPVLGRIPFIGAAFRHVSKDPGDTKTELIIAVTPKIIPNRKKSLVSGQDTKIQRAAKSFNKGNDEKWQVKAGPERADISGRRVDQEVSSYVQSIQYAISRAIQYPYVARNNNWEGAVSLQMHILSDGSLLDSSIKETSGYDLIDQDALNTARFVAPFSSFPDTLKLDDIIVTVPVVYNQSMQHKDLVNRQDIPVANKPANPPLSYPKLVQQKIAAAIVYPDTAKELGWEGTVVLNLHVLSDGTLAYAAIKESSGYDVFDKLALDTAKKVAPFSAFPPDVNLQEYDLTIPVVYRLD